MRLAYLRFTSESEANMVLGDAGLTLILDNVRYYANGVDVIGADINGDYLVNVLIETFPESLIPYEIPTPVTPNRVFAGWAPWELTEV